jgi:hypothetical protein
MYDHPVISPPVGPSLPDGSTSPPWNIIPAGILNEKRDCLKFAINPVSRPLFSARRQISRRGHLCRMRSNESATSGVKAKTT